MVVVGLLFVVAAWLAGPGRRALTVRGWLAPGLQNRVWAYVVLAVLGLLLLFTASVVDFTRLLVVALLVALGATWIELTRRQTLREFPDAQGRRSSLTPGQRLSDLVGGAAGRDHAARDRASSAAGGRAVPPAAPATDVASRLTALAELHAKGELTDEEYASAKARVLAGD